MKEIPVARALAAPLRGALAKPPPTPARTLDAPTIDDPFAHERRATHASHRRASVHGRRRRAAVRVEPPSAPPTRRRAADARGSLARASRPLRGHPRSTFPTPSARALAALAAPLALPICVPPRAHAARLAPQASALALADAPRTRRARSRSRAPRSAGRARVSCATAAELPRGRSRVELARVGLAALLRSTPSRRSRAPAARARLDARLASTCRSRSVHRRAPAQRDRARCSPRRSTSARCSATASATPSTRCAATSARTRARARLPHPPGRRRRITRTEFVSCPSLRPHAVRPRRDHRAHQGARPPT